MRDTYIEPELCIFLVQMFKIVSISLINFELVRTFYSVGCFQIYHGNTNTLLLLYTYEVIHLINKGVISPYVQE